MSGKRNRGLPVYHLRAARPPGTAIPRSSSLTRVSDPSVLAPRNRFLSPTVPISMPRGDGPNLAFPWQDRRRTTSYSSATQTTGVESSETVRDLGTTKAAVNLSAQSRRIHWGRGVCRGLPSLSLFDQFQPVQMTGCDFGRTFRAASKKPGHSLSSCRHIRIGVPNVDAPSNLFGPIRT